MNVSMQAAWLILNPEAAQDDALRAAVAAHRREGWRIEVRLTWEAGDAQRWAREAIAAGATRVVAAGGDGTLHEAVAGFGDAGAIGARDVASLAVLPYGTGNDFATAIGMRQGERAANLWAALRWAPRGTDLVEVDKLGLCINAISLGAGAQVTSGTPPTTKRLFGRHAYAIEGLSALVGPEAMTIEVDAPEASWSWGGQAECVVIANGPSAGGGFEIVGGAKLDDGLMDVVIVKALHLDDRLSAVAALLRGEHLAHEAVIHRRARRLRLRSPTELQVNLDGEPYFCDGLELGVLPEAISVARRP